MHISSKEYGILSKQTDIKIKGYETSATYVPRQEIHNEGKYKRTRWLKQPIQLPLINNNSTEDIAKKALYLLKEAPRS